MTTDDKQAMASAYKAQIAKYGTPISEEQYKELRKYAEDHRIRLSGFKDYVGDINTIKTVVDDICEIAVDFPKILDVKKGVILDLDYGLPDGDFATTDLSGHIIHLNAGLFGDLERLQSEYRNAMNMGEFVANTDWRGIVRHETGHVVEFFYHFDILGIIVEVLMCKPKSVVFSRIRRELSFYSGRYSDGREIIAECFSGYYGNAGNKIADAFVAKCLELRDSIGDAKGLRGDTMRANDEALYWMRNDSWSRVDEDRDILELTPEAPERAIASFRLYLESNNLPTEPLVFRGDQIGRQAERV